MKYSETCKYLEFKKNIRLMKKPLKNNTKC